ncbi:MAG: PAS domain S-box protein [Coriobacteriia bacterium]|nr:PAS domain S-box protein [Coriobacteriia bacterium]
MSDGPIGADDTPLQLDEALYRALFDLSPDPMVVHDGRIALAANRAAQEFFGVAEEQVAGRGLEEFIHPDYRVPIAVRVREMMVSHRVPPLAEIRVLRSDGMPSEVEISSAPIVAGARQVVVTLFRDLSERRQHQAELEESEAQFGSVLENAPFGVHMYRLKPDGRLVFVGANPAADRMLGMDNSVIIGKTIEEAFPGLSDTDVAVRYREVASTGRPWSSNQIDYHEGQIRGAFEVTAFRAARGLMVAMFNDVTERLQIQDQLQELLVDQTEALADAHRELEGVVAIVSRTVEVRDPYTAGHQRRVAQLARAIAVHLNMDAEEVERIRIAGSVHDIGKVSVPAEILSKPGKLTPAEYELVKYHSEAAHEILCSVDFAWPLAEVVYQHHERLDGSGYPRGLSGDEIAVGARILAVADVVEAMCSHRPYRPAIGADAALAEINEGSGRHYDPNVVEACVGAFDGGFAFE